jgi:Zn-dependent peptidase ImmA (M78 family)
MRGNEQRSFVEHVDILDGQFLREIARKYGVSTQALMNRLKNLGYITE